MSDKLIKNGGCDRKLETDPPDEGYVQRGWYCVYHDGEHQGFRCHNPLDCDIVPVWSLTREAMHERLAALRDDQPTYRSEIGSPYAPEDDSVRFR